MDSVVVLLGNGDGTFQNPAIYHLGHGAWDIALGDMNTDGKLDLVTANVDDTVSVMLGNPDGTFQTARTFAYPGLGARPLLAIGDINRDGKPDLFFDTQDGSYDVALGTGDGLTYKRHDESSGYVEFIVNSQSRFFGSNITTAFSRMLGDFNGDGFLDYGIGGDEGINDPELEIAVGDGRGTFWELLHDHNFPGWATLTNNCCEFEGNGATIQYQGAVINSYQWSAPPVDFNGDGKLDIVVARANPPVVTVYLNTTSSVNTNTGTSIPAQPVDTTTKMSPVTLSFSNVTQSGMTTLSTSSTGTAPPSGFQFGTPSTYYNLKTTATFSGTVSVCVNYAGTSFSGQTGPRLFHYENGAWVDITTSLDTARTTICGNATSFSPFIVAQPVYAAQIQQPINADGSSVFNANKGVVPVKFAPTLGNVPTCTLPTASIAVIRTSGSTPGTVDESVYENSSDNGSYFRVSGCQYIYNVASKSLGAGTYKVQIVIGTSVVGSGSFGLK